MAFPDILGAHKAAIIAMREVGAPFDVIGRSFCVSGVAVFARLKKWRPDLLGPRTERRNALIADAIKAEAA